MKRIPTFGVLICAAALVLTACSAPDPTTTTTRTTTSTAAKTTVTPSASATVTETATPTTTTTVSNTAAAQENAGATRYLHGRIASVNGDTLSLEDVPQMKTCTVKVDSSTQLVGVGNISEVEQNMHVIVGYAGEGASLLDRAGTMVSEAASGAAEIVTDVVEGISEVVTPDDPATTTAAETATTTAAGGATNGVTNMGGELVAVSLEIAEPLPLLSGKITQVEEEAFTLEDTAEGTVQVQVPEGVLMEGLTKPAEGEMVTVVYSGQIGKSSPASITAISITKNETTAK